MQHNHFATMEKRELEHKYAQLLSDPTFDKLTLRLQKPNIFKILGVADYEIRHSNFLAWLLNPHESHGLNEIFLIRFLQDIFIDQRTEGISLFEISDLDLVGIEVWREWNNIDILIYTNEIVICIENKIWSKEGYNQLSKYQKIVDSNFPNHKKAFVFLSPHGIESSEKTLYVNYSYQRISEIIDNLLEIRGHQISESIKTYLADYNTVLKQNIMNEDQANDWAKQLYKSHKELFDFIISHKPNAFDDFRIKLADLVEKKGWVLGSRNRYDVKFSTKAIEPLILKYKKANGWPNREAFQFELNFYDGKRISFSSYLSPAVDYFEYREKLIEILNEIEGANQSLGEKWAAHFKMSFPWQLEKNMEKWNEKKEEQILSFLDSIEPIVNQVESKMLEYSKTLIGLKEDFELNS